MKRTFALMCAMTAIGCVEPATGSEQQDLTRPLDVDGVVGSQTRLFRNLTGYVLTTTPSGSIDLDNPFFQSLGTNGRSCFSCHFARDGWTVTPRTAQKLFDLTSGTHPLFRTVDGATSPDADVSTLAARRQAYSMLLTKGLIRVGIGIPFNAEFELVGVDDPYHHASSTELSLFRRPLPATNLKFLSTVMWDGRETFSGQSIDFDLLDQANSATLGHAQAMVPGLTAAEQRAIVDLEASFSTAQQTDDAAGILTENGALGGPAAVAAQEFHIGINDNFGDPVTGAPFTPVVFDIYDAWASVGGSKAASRRAIARGQALFNTKPIRIAGVSGINDEDVFGNPAVVVGTCTTCHDTPNAGDHSVVAPLNLGLADASRRTPDLPLYTLRNKTTGETVQVTDPGRARRTSITARQRRSARSWTSMTRGSGSASRCRRRRTSWRSCRPCESVASRASLNSHLGDSRQGA